MDKSERKKTRRQFLQDSAAATLQGGLWHGLLSAHSDARGGQVDAREAASMPDAKSFRVATGEYILNFEKGMNYIAISRKEEQSSKEYLALRPGGGDPALQVLNSANIKTLTLLENEAAERVEIRGDLNWCHYQVVLLIPHGTPGMLNSRIEVEATREVGVEEGLFAGRFSELAYTEEWNSTSPERDWASIYRDYLIYYFNGTPGADAVLSIQRNSGALQDRNQFIYFGDPLVLKATLLYYEDFTSLNPFFKVTGTRIRDTVRQPPGCLRVPLTCCFPNPPADFGFDIPGIKKPLKQGDRLLVANSFIHLAPGAPDIHETTKYCAQFTQSVAAIYPYLAKPTVKFIDWPAITEQGLADMAACEKKVGRQHVVEPQTILNSCRRYAERFGSQRARQLVEDEESLWANSKMRLPFGDAWQYLFPLVMAGDYAEEFGSPAAKRSCLEAADDVVEAGRRLHYVFPLRINADFSKPPGVHYEYDCTGSYLYLMLLYHRLTGKAEYLEEARGAADRLLGMGFEFPYEFTTTALAPVALLRLYKLTGDPRYLEGAVIPIAVILRHSWLFNPDYQEYQGRTIFLLTESMPAGYSNGWEEATLTHFLNNFLVEGDALLSGPVREVTAELLRWKGVSEGDALPTLLPDPSIIYAGIPREWFIPVNRAWNIPLEGFGYMEGDDGGLSSPPGRVSQPPYCFGMLPEATLLLFHPLDGQVTLYVEAPIRLEKRDPTTFQFETLAGQEPFRAALQGEPERLDGASVRGRSIGRAESSNEVSLKKDPANSRLWFAVNPRVQYTISLGTS